MDYNYFNYWFVGLVAVAFALRRLQTSSSSSSTSLSAAPAAFTAFQNNYLLVYGLVGASDWIQVAFFSFIVSASLSFSLNISVILTTR
jgi:hypothetical protein